MKKLNNKGYLLVEIIVASVIAMVMAYFLIDVTIKIKDTNTDSYVDTLLLTDKALITKEIMTDIINYEIVSVNKISSTAVDITYLINDIEETKTLSIIDKTIKYGDYTKTLSDSLTIYNNEYITDYTSLDGNFLKFNIIAKTSYSDYDYGINILIPYK